MALSYIALLLVIMVSCSQSRKVILETDEGLISENVVSDPTGQTLLVTVGDVSMTEHFVSTVNLHDLSTGWTALKGDDVETCLLKPIQKTQPSGLQSLMKRKPTKGKVLFMRPVTFYWRVKPEVLSYEEIVELAGEKLADFCADFKTYVLVPKSAPVASKRFDVDGPITPNRRYKRDICFLCLWCCFDAGVVDLDEIDAIDTGDLKS